MSFKQRTEQAQFPFANVTELVHKLIDYIPVGISIFDAEGKIVQINRQQESILGKARSDFINRPVFDTPFVTQFDLTNYFAALFSKKSQHHSFEKQNKRTIHFTVPGYGIKIVPMLDAGDLSGAFMLMKKQVADLQKEQLWSDAQNIVDLIYTNSSDGLLCVSQDYSILRYNGSFLKLFGLSDKKNVKGELCYKILFGENAVCQDCAVLFAQNWDCSSKKEFCITKKMKDKVVEIKTVPLCLDDTHSGHVLVDAIELSADKRYQQKLQELSELYERELQETIEKETNEFALNELIFKKSGIDAILLDHTLHIADMTEKSARIFKTHAAGEIGAALPEAGDASTTHKLKEAIAQQKRESFNFISETSQVQAFNGCDVIPLSLRENENGALVVFKKDRKHDLTEHCGRKFLTKWNSFSELASVVAHQLNNPLANISNRVDCLRIEMQRSESYDKLSLDVEIVKEQAERIAQITKDLIAVSEIEPGNFTLVDVNKILENALATSYVSSAKSYVDVAMQQDLYLTPVRGNSHNLERCFYHILNNAIESMSAEGKLSITTSLIWDGRTVCIEIADTGMGMSSEVLEHVFEPFFTTKKFRRAQGLGLSISYAVLIDHGGTIRIKSEVGVGTVVTIELPVSERHIASAMTHLTHERLSQIFLGDELNEYQDEDILDQWEADKKLPNVSSATMHDS